MNRTPDAPFETGPEFELEASRDRFEHIGFRGLKKAAKVVVPRMLSPSPVKPFARSAGGTPPCDSSESDFVRGIVKSMGLRPEAYRMPPMLRRIPACLRALRADSIADASSLLDRHPEFLPRALNALLIGTTGFFRDAMVFDILRDSVVPDLVSRKRYPQVWSVACSDGSELHSVAMIFALFGDLSEGQFLGTDCRPAAIEKARSGIYAPDALGGIAEPFRSLFIASDRKGPSLSSMLRRVIEWRVEDVLTDAVAGTWDMILCRNLAIYLDPSTTAALWEKLASALAPGGTLVVGKAEKPRLACLRKIAPSIYQKSSSPSVFE